MFAATASRSGTAGTVDIAFTDRFTNRGDQAAQLLDLSDLVEEEEDPSSNWSVLGRAFGVEGFVRMRQTHGRNVCVVDGPTPQAPVCDALVTRAADTALCVRVADCVPVVLADADTGVLAVVHAGRRGVLGGVVGATVQVMREMGADTLEAWIGPHVCGSCYEVPDTMRAEVAAVVPATYSCTTRGTPALDLGAGVRRQLEEAAVVVHDLSRCTQESDDLFSYRRDGRAAGRSGGLVVRRSSSGG